MRVCRISIELLRALSYRTIAAWISDSSYDRVREDLEVLYFACLHGAEASAAAVDDARASATRVPYSRRARMSRGDISGKPA